MGNAARDDGQRSTLRWTTQHATMGKATAQPSNHNKNIKDKTKQKSIIQNHVQHNRNSLRHRS